MREIKLRVFDKTYYKKMFSVDKILFKDGKMTELEFADELICTNHDFLEIEIMQYTGLKDKNGVEIYEGDIVHITNVGIEEMPLEVYFEEEFAGFALKVTSSHWCYFDEVTLKMTEVIGNIHQNTELLK